MTQSYIPRSGRRRNEFGTGSIAVRLPGAQLGVCADTRLAPVTHAVGEDLTEAGTLRGGEGHAVRERVDRPQRALDDVVALRCAGRGARITLDRVRAHTRTGFVVQLPSARERPATVRQSAA